VAKGIDSSYGCNLVQNAIKRNVKNNKSLFQNTNAVNRHNSASIDLGSRDQSNMRWCFSIMPDAKLKRAAEHPLNGHEEGFLSAVFASF
jgi:hypothetical protein